MGLTQRMSPMAEHVVNLVCLVPLTHGCRIILPKVGLKALKAIRLYHTFCPC